MSEVEFRVLGPVGVWTDGRRLGPATAQQRTVLALLLLNLDSVVPVEKISTALWSGVPPASARNAIQGYVARLRRVLAGARGVAELATSGHGYQLSVDRSAVDLYRFRDLVARARAGDAASGEWLREALGLWRGPAFADVAGEWLPSAVAPALDEERLAAVEQRLAIDVDLGRHADAVAGLSAVVAEHPFRERSVVLLMTALHHSGRGAEALALYRDTRRRLVAEVGIEPGEELTSLHQRLLEASAGPRSEKAERAAPEAPADKAWIVPHQLPADVAGFVGRADSLSFLDALLPAQPASGGPVIAVVGGPPGAGKTTLAVRWAHRVSDRFPDGQLFVDMRGFHTGPRMTATEALPLLLVALGVAADRIPMGIDAQAALYRSVLAGRRVLLVLDNVADPDQVRPLVPGGPGCLVLVTSRDRLSGLVAVDGAQRLTLDVLSTSDAMDVLARAAGRRKLGSDCAAVAELAELCGRLPLALRIAGARLADQAHLGVRWHVDELAARGRMARLRVEGDDSATIRRAFDLSYQALPAAAARMFRLLGLVPAPGGLTSSALGALAGVPPADVEPLADALAQLHLVKVSEEGRLVSHDLLQEYAAQLAAEHDPPGEREAAATRLLHFYLHSADRAAIALNGVSRLRVPRDPPPDGLPLAEFADLVTARDWVATEWPNLVSALGIAASTGRDRLAWQLACAMHSVMRLRAPLAQWLSVAETGLAAARRAGDPLGEATMRLSLGFLHWRTAEFEKAAIEYGAAAALAHRAGWRRGRSAALCSTAIAYAGLGRTRPAIRRFEQALAIDREIGDETGESATLTNLAAAYEEVGDLSHAARLGELALPLLRRTGQHQGAAVASDNLATVHREQGRLAEARATAEKSVAICRTIGAQHEEASALITLGLVHRDAGRYDEAAAALTSALDIAQRLSDSRLEMFAQTGLAVVELRQGMADGAAKRLGVAIDIARRTGHRRGETEALIAQSTVDAARGTYDDAHRHATEALHLARTSGFALAAAHAEARLAAAGLGLDDATGAVEHCRRALATQRRAGQRLAQGRTLVTMGHAWQQLGNTQMARHRWQQAHALFTEVGAAEQHETAALLASARQ
ncbi:tetratricopeptide repeat protein [Micromonospora sp. CPCC 205371]|nr:tetratricopeptide repeat protein [Micromonospora sp. CPCC 205371]